MRGCRAPQRPTRPGTRTEPGTRWTLRTVVAILANPRYTGRQVWNRQPSEAVLVDPANTGLGTGGYSGGTCPKAGYLQAPGARGAGQRDRFHHGPGDDGAPWPGRPGGAPIPAGWAPGLRPVRAPTEISLVQRRARLPVPPRTYHRHRSRLRSPPEHLYPRRPDPAWGPLPLMDKGSRIAWICHVVTEAGEDLAEPQNISVDIDADLRRTRAHAAACCDSS
jgi:hypothetical protein